MFVAEETLTRWLTRCVVLFSGKLVPCVVFVVINKTDYEMQHIKHSS